MNHVGREIGKFGILVGILLLMDGMMGLRAETTLSAVRENSTTLEVELANNCPIAGIQFVLHSSPGISLREIHRYGRTSGGNWTVASNLVDDSTLKVVIVSTDLSYFGQGSGIVAEVTFSVSAIPSTPRLVTFSGVVAADPQAQSVTVTAKGLDLNALSPASRATPEFSLGQNFPNPFNPSTKISYTLGNSSAHVLLVVFDMTGREISRLVDADQTKGSYSVAWNSSEGHLGQLASGTYFARLQVNGKVATQKMVLVK